MRASTSWLLSLAAILWTALALLAPLATAGQWALAPMFYALFEPICHQSPERCFFFMGEPLAVCARCLGLYSGFWLGLVLLPFLGGFCRLLLDRPRILILFMFPLAVDFLLENTHASRYLSGLVASFPFALFAWVATEQFGESLQRTLRRNP
jgi:uncharacterized membrane protein